MCMLMHLYMCMYAYIHMCTKIEFYVWNVSLSMGGALNALLCAYVCVGLCQCVCSLACTCIRLCARVKGFGLGNPAPAHVYVYV